MNISGPENSLILNITHSEIRLCDDLIFLTASYTYGADLKFKWSIGWLRKFENYIHTFFRSKSWQISHVL